MQRRSQLLTQRRQLEQGSSITRKTGLAGLLRRMPIRWYLTMDQSPATVKSSLVTPDSDNAWDAILEGRISKARSECKGEKLGSCLSEFLLKLEACERVGGRRLRTYVNEIRRSAEAHASAAKYPAEGGSSATSSSNSKSSQVTEKSDAAQ